MIDPFVNRGLITAEAKIADTVQGQALPGLNTILDVLLQLDEIWNTPTNAIPAKIAAAATNEAAGLPGATLAGYRPQTWIIWGEVFKSALAYMDTPLTIQTPAGPLEITTRQAIRTVYAMSADNAPQPSAADAGPYYRP